MDFDNSESSIDGNIMSGEEYTPDDSSFDIKVNGARGFDSETPERATQPLSNNRPVQTKPAASAEGGGIDAFVPSCCRLTELLSDYGFVVRLEMSDVDARSR